MGMISTSVPLATVAISVSEAAPSAGLRIMATPPRGSTLATPQSITWTSPKLPTITFDGFKSRWITPRVWA